MSYPDDWGDSGVARFAENITADPSSHIEDGTMSFGRAPFDDVDPISIDDAEKTRELEITEIQGIKAHPDIVFIEDFTSEVENEFAGVDVNVGGWMHGPTNNAPEGLVFFDQLIVHSRSPSVEDVYDWLVNRLENGSDISEPEHIEREGDTVYAWWPR